MIHIELATPMDSKEVAVRKLPSELCRLLIRADSDDLSELAAITFMAMGQSHATLLAQTIILFSDVDRTIEQLSQHIPHLWTDSDIMAGKKRASEIIARCESGEQLQLLMEKLDAEALVLYSPHYRDTSDLPDVEVVRAAEDGYFEHKFTDLFQKYGIMGFFATSHLSVEFLGRQDAIVSAHEAVKDYYPL